MSALGAARTGDQIGHGIGMLGMLAGAVGGALVGMAIVAGTVATGGLLAGVIIAGSVAGGALATHQIIKGVAGVSRLPDPPTGFLAHGSHSVMINSLPAARATGDGSYACTGGVGMYWNHPVLPIMGILPSGILVAEGSKTVLFNNLPAARVGSVLTCGAKIVSGSPKVFIGGATVRTEFVWDGVGWLETGFLSLGMVALAGGAVIAMMAGVAATAGFAAITGASFGALEGLGQLGDMIGPGYRDLFQGVLGMGMLLAGPKLAQKIPNKASEAPPLIAINEEPLPGKLPQKLNTDSEVSPVTDAEWNALLEEIPEVQVRIPKDEILFFGHGEYFRGDGMVTVPKDTSITFYSEFGSLMEGWGIIHAAENGGLGKSFRLYRKTYHAGEEVPNYTLADVDPKLAWELALNHTVKTVSSNKTLSNLLRPGMGKCHWMACTYCEDSPNSRFLHTNLGVKDVGVPPELLLENQFLQKNRNRDVENYSPTIQPHDGAELPDYGLSSADWRNLNPWLDKDYIIAKTARFVKNSLFKNEDGTIVDGDGVPVDISNLQLKPPPPDYVTNEDGTLQPLRDVSEWGDESSISPVAPPANDERYPANDNKP